jgi:AraC-like DNA-binding protein
MKHPERENYRIVIDLKPALDEQTLDRRLLREFEANKNKDFINSLSNLLPNKLIPVIVRLSKIEPSQKCHSVTKEQRRNLVTLLKNLTVDIVGFRPVEEAIVTSGGVSIRECTRCFRRCINCSPTDYLTQVRVRRAAELLSKTPMSILDISEACGFSSSSYFSKVFREAYRCTPNAYRNHQR